MSKGIYAAASAMVAETRALEVTARNVAHASTAGYRRETALRTGFAAELARQGRAGGLRGDGGAGVFSTGSFFRFDQGTIEDTGATFDLALTGDGFFRVRDPAGNLHLTRAGRFQPDETGRLVDDRGWTLEGQGGAITIPPDAQKVQIETGGRVVVTAVVAGVPADRVVDQIRTATVDHPETMTALNGTHFDPGSQELRDAPAMIRQGAIERGNVEPVTELVDLIALQRRYDAAQKALSEQARAGEGFSDLLRGG